ncbi:MAG: SGNH/GDSL hydrolase family protein [Candidatus Limnocylindrales bacterium]
MTLGDSYTFGTGTIAHRRDSWPAQVAEALIQRAGMRIYLRNLAQKSSPSVEVIDTQLPHVGDYEPDVVTIQVGVDDIVGSDAESYAENIAHILDELMLVVPAERIFAITTPDHTLTEWGKAYGPPEVVEALNADLAAAADARGITVIDIGPLHERVVEDETLLVQSNPPRPYPTAKQYAGWAELIGPYIREALETIEP